jgi:hypothetical protein
MICLLGFFFLLNLLFHGRKCWCFLQTGSTLEWIEEESRLNSEADASDEITERLDSCRELGVDMHCSGRSVWEKKIEPPPALWNRRAKGAAQWVHQTNLHS